MIELPTLGSFGIEQKVYQEHDLPVVSIPWQQYRPIYIPIIFTFGVVAGIWLWPVQMNQALYLTCECEVIQKPPSSQEPARHCLFTQCSIEKFHVICGKDSSKYSPLINGSRTFSCQDGCARLVQKSGGPYDLNASAHRPRCPCTSAPAVFDGEIWEKCRMRKRLMG